MKRVSLLLFALTILANAQATVHTVTVQDFSFTPSTIPNVHPHDTVKWTWVSGTHTTTSTTIPSTATPWNANMTSTSTSFMYVPTVVGTYNYNCAVHPTMMIASFTVVSATNVAPVSNAQAAVYPNPATTVLHFNLSNPNTPATVNITDMSGRAVAVQNIQPIQNSAMDIRNIPDGLYFVRIMQGEMVLTREITISR